MQLMTLYMFLTTRVDTGHQDPPGGGIGRIKVLRRPVIAFGRRYNLRYQIEPQDVVKQSQDDVARWKFPKDTVEEIRL